MNWVPRVNSRLATHDRAADVGDIAKTRQRWIAAHEADIESSQSAVATAVDRDLDGLFERLVKILECDLPLGDDDSEVSVGADLSLGGHGSTPSDATGSFVSMSVNEPIMSDSLNASPIPLRTRTIRKGDSRARALPDDGRRGRTRHELSFTQVREVLDWQAGGCDEKCDRAQRVRHRRGSVRPAMGPHDNRGAFDVGDVLHSAS